MGHHAYARIDSRLGLHAGSHQGRGGLDQRYGLPLHIGAHQCPVGVVVLQERDQRGRRGNQLMGRHIHVLDFRASDHHEFTPVT